jgi:hypothetical protein
MGGLLVERLASKGIGAGRADNPHLMSLCCSSFLIFGEALAGVKIGKLRAH